jgi:hypothetical protein
MLGTLVDKTWAIKEFIKLPTVTTLGTGLLDRADEAVRSAAS